MKREYWKYLPTIFPYLKRYKLLATASLLLVGVGTVVALAEPWPLAFLVDSALGSEPAPGWVSALVGDTPGGMVVFTVIASIGLVALTSGVGVVDSYVNTRLEQRMALDFRSDLFEHCQKLSQSYHDQRTTGDFMYRINNEAHAVGAVTVAFPPLLQSVLTLIGMFYVTYRIAPLLALLSLSVMPFIYYSVGQYGKRVEPRLIRVRMLEGLSLQIVNDVFSRLKAVVAFNRQDHEHRRFRAQGESAVQERIRVTVAQTVFGLAVGLITACGTGLIIGVGAHYVLDGRMSVGQLLVVLSYVAAMYTPLQTISSTLGEFQGHFVALRFARQLLETEPGVNDAPDALALGKVTGSVDFEHVSFDYEGRTGTIKDVTFSVAPGQVVAVVGPTGAGKTTVANLLSRFYDPREGRILVDRHDIREVTQRSLRHNISLVTQEPLLIPASVAENIRYGRMDATDDEIVEAAKAANAHDFIMKLPEGYDTSLGERAARISGGERQRICIARAFVKGAPILVLDEPTASIDSRTEAVILDALDRLMEGRTTFMIAHRLSTLRRADQILVMNDGELLEHGTHEELMSTGGLYRTLHELQSGPATPSSAHSVGVEGPPPDEPVRPVPVPLAAGTVAAPGRPKVVVLGMMTKSPVAGVVWQTVQYLLGFERLGFEAYYVEAHARTPSMLMESDNDDGSQRAASFIADVMRRFGLGQRWAFHALHDDAACYGMTHEQLQRLYRSAALVVNLHGGTRPLAEHAAGQNLIYVETDPVQLQIELSDGVRETADFLEPHVAFFTFGENLGNADCPLPVSDRFEFRPTRQPVLAELWASHGSGPAGTFTTIASWRQPWRPVRFRGETYHWSKDLEFEKVLELPARTSQRFELALSDHTGDDEQLLRAHGWAVRPAMEFSLDLDEYRHYISRSRAEFTVAKDQNVRLRSGWFSDRSATYLASGRPVVTQQTGFDHILPTGEGLFAFTSLDEAVASVEAVNGSYERQCVAAREIAREYFEHDRVLGAMVSALGLSASSGAGPRPRPPTGLPDELVLTPEAKRPLRLPPATIDAVLDQPLPAPPAGTVELPRIAKDGSIVVVTCDNLVTTRLCLESVLETVRDQGVEVIVVDNASSAPVVEYLRNLAERFVRVRLVLNETNEGFPKAVNQGLHRARGDVLVVLNDDVIVTPDWFGALTQHLDDRSIGLVGARTNAAPNEARLPTSYGTYGELRAFAAEQTSRRARRCFDIQVATMFCAATRRDVIERVGVLDERFGLGLFEDDDFSLRVRGLGYRVVCAEDVFVHHFGEASFGKLAATGEYAAQFRASRRRFEDKWGAPWSGHAGERDPDYERVKRAVHVMARVHALPWGRGLVVSNGDEELVELDGELAGHFPQEPDGTYAGYHPGDSTEAIHHLESLRDRGAQFVLFPKPSLWWLEHYTDLRRYLRGAGTEIVHDPDSCVIYAFDGNGASETAAAGSVGGR